MRVLDGAVGIFCAVAGVQPQSETVWRQADRYRVPRIAFINKMDRVGADFTRAVSMIRERLGSNAVLLQIPIGNEENFTGVIDLIEMKAYEYEEGNGEIYLTRDLDGQEMAEASKHRENMLEIISENDDDLLEKYLEAVRSQSLRSKSSLRKTNHIQPLGTSTLRLLI